MSDNTHQTTYAFTARATTPEELAGLFMNPNRAKTEAEHWAVREIERLRAEYELLRADILDLKADAWDEGYQDHRDMIEGIARKPSNPYR